MLKDHSTHTSEPETAPTVSSQDVPFASEFIRISRQEKIQLEADRNRYKSLHQRALMKIKGLEEELTLSKGKVRDLSHRLYGKKTEKAASKPEATPPSDDFVGPPRPPAKRGASNGRANRPRNQHPDLPVVEEIIPIPEDQLCCSDCGEAYVPFPKTEDSEIIEIHVAAYA